MTIPSKLSSMTLRRTRDLRKAGYKVTEAWQCKTEKNLHKNEPPHNFVRFRICHGQPPEEGVDANPRQSAGGTHMN